MHSILFLKIGVTAVRFGASPIWLFQTNYIAFVSILANSW
jgi:hypothetical protein